MVPVSNYLILSALLFVIGAVGVVVRRNLIVMLMCVELMLNAVNLSFLGFARELGQLEGQLIVFFVMTVAAAEAAVGLALAVVLNRHNRTLDVDQADRMKW